MKHKATLKDNLFPEAATHHAPIMRGMEYGMMIKSAPMEVPNVPLMQRQSLGQRGLIHRYQISRYLSNLRYYGLRPDYPVFHGKVVINSAPKNLLSRNPQPTTSRRTRLNTPATRDQGVMGASRRFSKALRLPINPYTPPTY